MRTRELLSQEWTTFRRPGRLIALAAAAVIVIGLGVLMATGVQMACDGPCPSDPKAADGSVVGDRFWFVHRDLGRNGSITVRLASMHGTITYPPPNHDQIVSGLVPWAKTGIIVKDGVRQGTSYAALMLTGAHGVRMQYDYRHDIAGMPGSGPRWLRLTRTGDTITGYESANGEQWSKVGTATLTGLPETVQVGMFAASPGDLTLRRVALGGAVEEVRFSQATGVFDHITVSGATGAGWRDEPVGQMNGTDWEKYHNASGAVWTNGTVKVSGTGDIGPAGTEGGFSIERTLLGLVVALIIVLVVGARFGASAGSRQALTARAVVVGAAVFLTGLVAAGATILVSVAILRGKGAPILPVPAFTGVRVVVGVALVLALAAVLALALGALLRRRWLAVVVAITAVALPYALGTLPLLPDEVSQWLLTMTPAAGFAVQQTLVEYPQVVAHYAPSAGYYPLPAWAGLAVLCAYTLAVLTAGARSMTTAESSSRRERRQPSRDTEPYSLS